MGERNGAELNRRVVFVVVSPAAARPITLDTARQP
jgi:hypothetical protein